MIRGGDLHCWVFVNRDDCWRELEGLSRPEDWTLVTSSLHSTVLRDLVQWSDCKPVHSGLSRHISGIAGLVLCARLFHSDWNKPHTEDIKHRTGQIYRKSISFQFNTKRPISAQERRSVKSVLLIDMTGAKEDTESEVIFLSNCKPFAETVTERLAEVNTSPTLLPSVCSNLILLSSSAAVSSWAKCPQAFTANLQTWNQKLNLSDSSLHLLSSHVSSPFRLACLLTHKVAEFLLCFTHT